MKIIKHSDIVALGIPAMQFMMWVKEALYQQYDSIVPPKISVHLPNDGFFNTMPCYMPLADAMGVKVVNRYLSNDPALDATLMLYQASTGKLKAIMDATLITTMRTGAVAATSIIELKKKDTAFCRLSVMGLGVTARATILCLLEASPNESFEIKLLRYKDQAELFAQRFAQYENATFTIVDNYEDLIIDADVIVSCITSATELIGRDEWFQKGVLLVPVHTRGFQNCDLFFDKVFGDVTGQISHFKYFEQFKYFDEFARVIRGDIKGRDNDKQRILVYNIGQALHDIYIADKIIGLIDSNEIAEFDIKETLPKFYI